MSDARVEAVARVIDAAGQDGAGPAWSAVAPKVAAMRRLQATAVLAYLDRRERFAPPRGWSRAADVPVGVCVRDRNFRHDDRVWIRHRDGFSTYYPDGRLCAATLLTPAALEFMVRRFGRGEPIALVEVDPPACARPPRASAVFTLAVHCRDGRYDVSDSTGTGVVCGFDNHSDLREFLIHYLREVAPHVAGHLLGALDMEQA